MREFKSISDYWKYEREVKSGRRYFLNKDEEDFLEVVLATTEKRVETIPEGTKFCRAQLGSEFEKIVQDGEYIDDKAVPFGPKRMKPLKDRATGGRANPKGIPCLYVATKRKIAIAEVRPWIGSYVSVGKFKTLRPLRVVNCTLHKDKNSFVYLEEEPPAENREESVWWDIDWAFARPVTPADNIDDYAPTQIIAELFKTHGFDGIAYRSALDNSEDKSGHNIALFDLDAVEVEEDSINLNKVKNVIVESEPY